MNPSVLKIATLLLAMNAACGSSAEDRGPDTQPARSPEPIVVKGPIPPDTALICPKGTFLTYENFGAAFLSNHCLTCHSRNIPTAQRSGAPDSVNFDSALDAALYRTLIFAKTQGTNPTMPPGGTLTSNQKLALAEWLNCGAPAKNSH